jgi:hypothetical protein
VSHKPQAGHAKMQHETIGARRDDLPLSPTPAAKVRGLNILQAKEEVLGLHPRQV